MVWFGLLIDEILCYAPDIFLRNLKRSSENTKLKDFFIIINLVWKEKKEEWLCIVKAFHFVN